MNCSYMLIAEGCLQLSSQFSLKYWGDVSWTHQRSAWGMGITGFPRDGN